MDFDRANGNIGGDRELLKENEIYFRENKSFMRKSKIEWVPCKKIKL
jgi:hypothetical protein